MKNYDRKTTRIWHPQTRPWRTMRPMPPQPTFCRPQNRASASLARHPPRRDACEESPHRAQRTSFPFPNHLPLHLVSTRFALGTTRRRAVPSFRHRGGSGNKTPPPNASMEVLRKPWKKNRRKSRLHGRQCPPQASSNGQVPKFSIDATQTRRRLRLLTVRPARVICLFRPI